MVKMTQGFHLKATLEVSILKMTQLFPQGNFSGLNVESDQCHQSNFGANNGEASSSMPIWLALTMEEISILGFLLMEILLRLRN